MVINKAGAKWLLHRLLFYCPCWLESFHGGWWWRSCVQLKTNSAKSFFGNEWVSSVKEFLKELLRDELTRIELLRSKWYFWPLQRGWIGWMSMRILCNWIFSSSVFLKGLLTPAGYLSADRIIILWQSTLLSTSLYLVSKLNDITILFRRHRWEWNSTPSQMITRLHYFQWRTMDG